MKKPVEINNLLVRIMAVAGYLLWSITYILRNTAFDKNYLVSFMMGVLPNFGVALSTPFLMILLTGRFIKMNHVKKEYYIFYFSLPVIFLILFLSEIWHDKYMNSPFDINDIFASSAALIICIPLYMAISRRY